MEPIVINAPSLANCNTLHIKEDIEQFRQAGVKYFHVDIMDGHYVPNLCFPLRFLKDLKEEYPDMILDVHMMVTNPIEYVDIMAEAGIDYLSFHEDSTPFVIRTLERIRANGIKPGVVINPSQPVDVIKPYIDLVDMVTLMAVEPGFSGQKFMTRTIDRVEKLASLRKYSENDFLINVDGAINDAGLVPCVRRGANVIVTGVFTVFAQEDGIVSACHRFDETCKKGMADGFIGDAY